MKLVLQRDQNSSILKYTANHGEKLAHSLKEMLFFFFGVNKYVCCRLVMLALLSKELNNRSENVSAM